MLSLHGKLTRFLISGHLSVSWFSHEDEKEEEEEDEGRFRGGGAGAEEDVPEQQRNNISVYLLWGWV